MPPSRAPASRLSFTLLRAVALSVARKMGTGHREAVYQRAFVTVSAAPSDAFQRFP